jgi:hypothetical protein
VKITYKDKTILDYELFSVGRLLALGMAWHFYSGFWNIFLDTFLGWIYVGYKCVKLLWPI